MRVGHFPSPFLACSTEVRSSRFATCADTEKCTIPEPPTNCCMSGCAKCVWIEYANELGHILQDRAEVTEHILNAVEDPSLKIFLSIELKDRILSDHKSEKKCARDKTPTEE